MNNRKDDSLLGTLPNDIKTTIVSFLTRPTLGRLARTSSKWKDFIYEYPGYKKEKEVKLVIDVINELRVNHFRILPFTEKYKYIQFNDVKYFDNNIIILQITGESCLPGEKLTSLLIKLKRAEFNAIKDLTVEYLKHNESPTFTDYQFYNLNELSLAIKTSDKYYQQQQSACLMLKRLFSFNAIFSALDLYDGEKKSEKYPFWHLRTNYIDDNHSDINQFEEICVHLEINGFICHDGKEENGKTQWIIDVLKLGGFEKECQALHNHICSNTQKEMENQQISVKRPR